MSDTNGAEELSADEVAALHRAVGTLETAQALAGVGSWERDLVNDTVTWSDEIFRVLGLEPQQFLPSHQRYVAGLVHPDDRDRVAAQMTEAIASPQGRYDVTYRIRRADGRVRHIHAVGQVIWSEEGAPERMVGTVLDITDRVDAEERATEHAAQLAAALHRVEEAAAAERRAVMRERRFLAAISHELRTPLTIIQGAAQTLRLVGDDEAIRDQLVRALGEHTHRLGGLVEDLLLVAQADRVRPVRPTRHSTTDLIHDAVERLMTTAEVRVLEPSVPASVEVDRQAVARALHAMLDNAARFGDGQPIDVEVSVQGRDLVVEVADRGPGIPTESRLSVFDPFTRAAASIAHSPGAGVGLTVVHLCAGIHGGDVTIDDRAGGGTVVQLRLAEVVVDETVSD